MYCYNTYLERPTRTSKTKGLIRDSRFSYYSSDNSRKCSKEFFSHNLGKQNMPIVSDPLPSGPMTRSRRRESEVAEKLSALSLNEVEPITDKFGKMQKQPLIARSNFQKMSYPTYYATASIYSNDTLWHSQFQMAYRQQFPRPMSYPFSYYSSQDQPYDFNGSGMRKWGSTVGSVKPRKKSPDLDDQFDSSSWTERKPYSFFDEDFSDEEIVTVKRKSKKLDRSRVTAKTNIQNESENAKASGFITTMFFISLFLNIVLMSWFVLNNFDFIVENFQGQCSSLNIFCSDVSLWLQQSWVNFKINHNTSLEEGLRYVKIFYSSFDSEDN